MDQRGRIEVVRKASTDRQRPKHIECTVCPSVADTPALSQLTEAAAATITARVTADRPRQSAIACRFPRRLRVWAALATLVYPAYLGWVGPPAARVQLIAQPLLVNHATKVAGPDDDLFPAGMTTRHDHDEALWLSWSLVDTARGERAGSANSATDRTNAESSIKAWIAADYLRVVRDQGRTVTGSEQAAIAATVRKSDNEAAERLYRALGGDEVLRHLEAVCNVSVSTAQPGYWSLTQITAVDATEIFACVLRIVPEYPGGVELLTDLQNVDPGGAFGIKPALPESKIVSLKNGWTRHSTTRTWNVNCVAAWDDYVLAILTRYPMDRPLDHGADVCRDVTASLLERLSSDGRGGDDDE